MTRDELLRSTFYEAASPELRELTIAHCNGELTDEQRQRLEHLLACDERARLFFLAHMGIHGELQWMHRSGAEEEEAAHPAADPFRLDHATPRRLARRLAAAAVLLVAAALLALSFAGASDPDNPDVSAAPFATLAYATDAAWAQRHQPPALGHRYGADDVIEIDSGRVGLIFDNGVQLVVDAPARLSLTSPRSAQLDRGAAYVQTDRAAGGFQVSTPSARIVDLSTSFAVRVAEDSASTELAVVEGVVECFALSDQGVTLARTVLTTGESVEVEGKIVRLPPGGSPLLAEASAALNRNARHRAYWRFEQDVPEPRDPQQTQLAVVADSSGHRRPLDYWPGGAEGVGRYAASTDVPPAHMFRPGHFGGHRSFDAGSATADLAGGLTSDAGHGSIDAVDDGFTIEGYFKTHGDLAAAGSMVLLYQGEQAFTYIMMLNRSAPGDLRFSVLGADASGELAEPVVHLDGKNFADGRWHYFAIRYERAAIDGASDRLRIDVVDELGRAFHNETRIDGRLRIATSSKPLLVGTLHRYLHETPKLRFRGLIDELRISDVPLQDEELIGWITPAAAASSASVPAP